MGGLSALVFEPIWWPSAGPRSEVRHWAYSSNFTLRKNIEEFDSCCNLVDLNYLYSGFP